MTDRSTPNNLLTNPLHLQVHRIVFRFPSFVEGKSWTRDHEVCFCIATCKKEREVEEGTITFIHTSTHYVLITHTSIFKKVERFWKRNGMRDET